MYVRFVVDTNGYPAHVRLLETCEAFHAGFPISPAEAIQLGGMLIQAGQHLLNDETNKVVLIKDLEVDTVQTKRL